MALVVMNRNDISEFDANNFEFYIDKTLKQSFLIKYISIHVSEDFLRSASSLIEIIKKKSCLLLNQLEVNRTIETNKWNDIKIEIDEVLQSQLKSIDLNTRLYEEYGRKFQRQSNIIEAAYQEIRVLVSK